MIRPGDDAAKKLDPKSMAAVIAFVLGYPLFRVFVPLPSTGTRIDWWIYWFVVIVGHWVCFIIIWWDIRRTDGPECWKSIGLDWSWFRRFWWVPAIILGFQVTNAVAETGEVTKADLDLYQYRNVWERLLFATAAPITAGIVEETLFRGYAITRLSRLFGNAWVGLPIPIVGFVFLHGAPTSLNVALAFAAGALVFSIAFILMKKRRLEILICVHAAI